MLVLMTTDAVGGVWNYCIRLAEALDAYDVQIALATMGPALNEHQRHEARRLANVQLYESTFKLEWMRDPWDEVDRAGRWLLDLDEVLHAADAGEMGRQMERVLTDADTARALAGHGLDRIRSRHTCVHRVDELLAIYRGVSQ